MKSNVRLVLLIVLACGAVFAQETSTSAATKEDIETLFTTMHIREQIHNVMEAVSKQSRQMTQDTLKKKFPDLTEKDANRVNEFTDRIWSQMDFDGMIEDMVPVYQRHLTKEDVSAMKAFYETPTGQKLLREQPAMTAEAMQAMQPRMEKMMSSVMEQADKMAKEAMTAPKPANTVKN